LTWNMLGTHACEGDLVQLVGLRHKHFLVRLLAGKDLQTHRGVLKHDDLIGLPWGTQVFSHLGNPFFLLQPALADLLREIPRSSQILYPKDIGFILVTMGIGPGQHVVEAGTGSGSFTAALAYAVGSEGSVTTYENRPIAHKKSQENLKRLGLEDRVVFKLQDITEGFDEEGVDSLFLDVQNPFDFIPQVRHALKLGGYFGSILPTTNQVVRLINALRHNQFAFIEVCEIMLRYYRPDAQRLRPADRMVAHTGYLIFARPVLLAENPEGDEDDNSRALADTDVVE